MAFNHKNVMVARPHCSYLSKWQMAFRYFHHCKQIQPMMENIWYATPAYASPMSGDIVHLDLPAEWSIRLVIGFSHTSFPVGHRRRGVLLTVCGQLCQTCWCSAWQMKQFQCSALTEQCRTISSRLIMKCTIQGLVYKSLSIKMY